MKRLVAALALTLALPVAAQGTGAAYKLDEVAVRLDAGAGGAGTSVTLPIPVADGGTGDDLSAIAKGGILSGTGAGTIGITTVGADALVLTADAASAGGVKWAAGPAPAAAGLDTQVLFNDGGALAGDAGLTYSKATNGLSVFGPILAQPLADAQSMVMRRFGAAQTNKILQVQTELNAEIASIAADGSADFTSLTLDNPLAVAEGGTGADLSAVALGGLITGTGAGAVGVKAVGANGTFLKANDAVAGGVEWAAGGGGVTNAAGANVLTKSDGTNLVASSISDTGSAITVGTASGTPQAFTYKLAADGTGSNIGGATATVLSGIGTGTGAASRLLLGGPKVGSTGAAAQSTATPVSIGGEVKADGTESFLNVTGTLPSAPSAAVAGTKLAITGAGNAAQVQGGLVANLVAGYTGASATRGIETTNSSASTGTGYSSAAGILGASNGAATSGVGVLGAGLGGGTRSTGVIGAAAAGTHRIGVWGGAQTNSGTSRYGGYFMLSATAAEIPTPTTGTAALAADNEAVAANIFEARDNGVTKVSIENGGALCGNDSKTLTESSATGFVEIAVASGQVASAVIDYEIEANDGTDFQTLTGTIRVSGVNKAGTVTATVGEVGTPLNAVSTGTLTNTMTVTAGTLKFTVNANAVSSLTQTTLRIKYLVRAPKPVTATSL